MMKNMSVLVEQNSKDKEVFIAKRIKNKSTICNSSINDKKQKVNRCKSKAMTLRKNEVIQNDRVQNFVINDDEERNQKALQLYEQNIQFRQNVVQNISILDNLKINPQQSIFNVNVESSSSKSSTKNNHKNKNLSPTMNIKIKQSKNSLINLSKIRCHSARQRTNDNKLKKSLVSNFSNFSKVQKLRDTQNSKKNCCMSKGNVMEKNIKVNKDFQKDIVKINDIKDKISLFEQRKKDDQLELHKLCQNMKKLWKTDNQIVKNTPNTVYLDLNNETLEIMKNKRLRISSIKQFDKKFIKFEKKQKYF